jgi:hypothetical protein
VVCLAWSCESSDTTRRSGVAGRLTGDAAPVAVTVAQPRAGKVFVTAASRCGECHEKMFDEWSASAHARAASSPVYRAAVATAKDATCARCHAPLAGMMERDVVAMEGVTCDVCHTLREPKPAVGGGGFRLAVDDMVKFGPRCDLPDHYFHRMGCSPEHKQASICGSCHWWEPNGLPVFTEYADWLAGPASSTPCQSCHMPRERAALAVGSPVRTGVPHHGLLGLATDLRKRALGLEVSSRHDAAAGETAVTVTLTNTNAGHFVPAGLPERRIAVRVTVGGEIQTRTLGRVLVDASGADAPFWRASKVASDTRIAPRESWRATFTFHARDTALVEVLYRSLSDNVARELGLEVEEQLLTRTRVRVGKTSTVKPPPPGQRPPS